MNIALFGGTFDPIHRGHLAIARAARAQFGLRLLYFVPADVPPHKQQRPVCAFEHRYAMVALATAAEKAFVPSLLEAPPRYQNVLAFRDDAERREYEANQRVGPSYSIDTVRRMKQSLPQGARLFFLIGIDAFREIATWREPEALLREAEFIVASRPGFSLADVAASLPGSLRARAEVIAPSKKAPARGSIVLPGATIHLLDGVQEKVSATQIRQAAEGKRPLARYVDAAVAAYIRKQGLYLGESSARPAKPAHRRGAKARK